jgi:hypothetical protein
MTLEEIVEKLYDRRPGVVAKATGLRVSVISQIRNGKNVNPSWKVISKLTRYFEEQGKDTEQCGHTAGADNHQ